MHSFKHHQVMTSLMLGSVSLLPLSVASAQNGAGAQPGRVRPSAPPALEQESKPVQTLTLDPPPSIEIPAAKGSWCLTPSIMEILAKASRPPVTPALDGTITAIDAGEQTLTITLELSRTSITVPATRLIEEAHGIQAVALKAGDSVFLFSLRV